MFSNTVQFENSLGRLTSSNVHSPRQIIDVHDDGPNQKEPVKGHELRRLKQILLDIEKVEAFQTAIDVLSDKVSLEQFQETPPCLLVQNNRSLP